MRVECAECGAAYNVQPAEEERRAKCKQCGDLLTIPAHAAKLEDEGEEVAATPPPTTREEREARRRAARPGLSATAILVAVVSFLLGLVFLPVILVMGLGLALGVVEGDAPQEATTMAGAVLVLAITVAGILVLGGVGLLLRKAWGWWASILIYGFFVLFMAKLMLPLGMLNWDHPDAMEIALVFVLVFGIPLLGALAMIGLLMLPKMRIAYGVKGQKRTRRRTASRLPS